MNDLRLQSFQIARGIAAFSVAVYHTLTLCTTKPPLPVAAAGTDIFFIISGAVMLLAVDKNTNPFEFLLKRIARIFPLYLILTCLVMAYYFLRFKSFLNLKYFFYSLILLPYQPMSGSPVLYVGWTLSLELLFYFIIFFVLLYTRKSMVPVMLILAGLSSFQFEGEPYFIQFFCCDRLLEFMVGIILGYMIKNHDLHGYLKGLAFIIVALILYTLNEANSGVSPTRLWGVPSFFMLAGLLCFEKTRLTTIGPLIFLGDMSYSLYLVHPFPIWVAEWIFGSKLPFFAVPFILLMTLGASWLTYIYLERPLLKYCYAMIQSRGVFDKKYGEFVP